MSAVIRVKRRCDEEPLDAFVLNCKRRKTEDSGLESTVLKFAGTLENQADDIFKHIKPTKAELEEGYKKHFTEIRDKLRDRVQAASKTNRYKVVNLHRSDKTEATENKNLTIVDIETNEEDKENSKYVYDLYYTNSDDLGEFYEHDLVGIYPLNDELVNETHHDDSTVESESSEDSNDENNWRNDYPDEDENSITEDDMLDAIKRVHIKDDEDLSDDDGEEGFVYSIDSEGAGFEEDIDDSDVNRYGERYARFKARHKENSPETFSGDYDDDEDDEENSGYYY